MQILKSNITDPRWTPRLGTTWAVIHHAKALFCTIEDINRWHIEKGFHGIGYHLFVDKKGNVWEGRPLEVAGAHSYGYNEVSIGICLEGNFEIEKLGKIQKLALIDALNYVVDKYPNIKVVPHNYLNDTECPVSLANELPDILSKIEKKPPEKSFDEKLEELKSRQDDIDFIIARMTDKIKRLEKVIFSV